MGNTLWIKPANASVEELSDDLNLLYDRSQKIDKLCRTAGVRKLSEFHDNSDMAAEFGHEIPPLESDPTELLQSLKAVKRMLPDAKFTKEETAYLTEELDYCIKVASECQRKGIRVRLIVLM